MLDHVYNIIIIAVVVFAWVAIICARTTIGGMLQLALYLVFACVLVLAGNMLTGYPREASKLDAVLYGYEDSKLRIISYQLIPNEAIYIWAMNSTSTPMNIKLAWDMELAEMLHRSSQEAQQSGGQMMLDMAGEGEGEQGSGGESSQEATEGAEGAGGAAGGEEGGKANYFGAGEGGPAIYVQHRDFALKE